MKVNGFSLPLTLFLLLLLLIAFQGTAQLFQIQYRTEKIIQKQYQAKSHLRLGLENHQKQLSTGTTNFIVEYAKNIIRCQLEESTEQYYTFQAIVKFPKEQSVNLTFYWDKNKKVIHF